MEVRKRNPKMTLADYDFLREHLTLAELVGAREFQGTGARAGAGSILQAWPRGRPPHTLTLSLHDALPISPP